MGELRHQHVAALALLCIAGLSTGRASAQTLGELARQTRAQQGQQGPPAGTYTNADLPNAGASPPAAPAPAAAAGETTEYPAALEAAWRAKFAAAWSALATAQKALGESQRALNLAQVQYYANPTQALEQQYSRSDIARLTAAVADWQARTAADEAALEQLEKSLRTAGLPAAWGRP